MLVHPLLAAVALLVAATAAPAKSPPCAGRYLIDGAGPPFVGDEARLPAVTLDAAKVALSGGVGCSFTTAHRQRTRQGWKVTARWDHCGSVRTVRLQARVDAGCTRMRGTVRARGLARTPYTAIASVCGDGRIDPEQREGCEPPDRSTCRPQCRRVLGPRCGDGSLDTGEDCDDGNATDGDGCSATCTCADGRFAGTWEAIQQRVLARHDCANAGCHGQAGAGGLDLRTPVAYRNLVDVPATAVPSLHRVQPGDRSRSFLWQKLAKATLPDEYGTVPGAGMPNGGAPLSDAELEAVRLWIQAGAPETGAVQDTDRLLATCLPPPAPLKIVPLAPPPAGQGVQLKAPPWPIPPRSRDGRNGEDEVCYATYYDFSAQIPDEAKVPCDAFWGSGRTCFLIHRTDLTQDPNSHHSIIHYYRGRYDVTDPRARFGPFTCRGGSHDGQACNPKDPLSCGTGGGCTGQIVSSVACIGYGPDDAFDNLGNGNNVPIIGGSQQPHYAQEYPAGVFWTLPVSGVIVWNSHAFNVSDRPTTNEQYYNLYFAGAHDRQAFLRGIFDTSHIFVHDVPPFERREYCATHTLPQGARLFELTSHTHKRGVLFRIWGPGITPCTPGPGCMPESGPPLAATTHYSDPIQYRYPLPLALDGDAVASRTFKYCAVFDNGFEDPATVKRASTSPPVPNPIAPGGPCAASERACVNYARRGHPCGGDAAVCDSSPGAGDGMCDACPLGGGVTTEDEMFILLGSGYCAPGSACERSDF